MPLVRNYYRTPAVILIAMAILPTYHCHAIQHDPTPLKLEVLGKRGQTIAVVARYYDNRQLAASSEHRIELTREKTPLELDSSHSGVRLTISIPTVNTTSVLLRHNGKVVEQRTQTKIGVFEITYGDVSKEDPGFIPPRFLPSSSEKQFIRGFLEAIQRADTRPFVSAATSAHIDWQTLDAFSQACRKHLGPLHLGADSLDGWITWTEDPELRGMSGHLVFERGSCELTLVVRNEKVADISIDAPKLPSDWFTGPASSTAYQTQSVRLAERLFAGNPQGALELFSKVYQDEITIESLKKLSDALRENFGQAVLGEELKSAILGPIDPNNTTQVLKIVHLLKLNSGKTCISTVQFVFTCGTNEISRGRLATINIREAWSSAAPQQIEVASKSIESVFSSNNFLSLLHPDVLSITDSETVGSQLAQLNSAYDGSELSPDLDLWNVTTQGELAQASGSLSLTNGNIDVQIDFFNDQLIGFTLIGNQFSTSSLNWIVDKPNAAKTSQEFWTQLFNGNLNSAHEKLSAAFQQRLPLEQFRKMVESSPILKRGVPSQVSVSNVRLANRLQRTHPIMVTVFCIASFSDGTQQPLRCEFRIEDEKAEIFSFDTDFETVFPVPVDQELERILNAFRSEAPAPILKLVARNERNRIDTNILADFLENLREKLGHFASPKFASRVHQYKLGKRTERITGLLNSENAKSTVPFEFSTQAGSLKSFRFYSDELARFVDDQTDLSSSTTLVNRLFEAWLDQDNHQQLKAMLVPDLRDETTRLRFAEFRKRILAEEEYDHVSISSPVIDAEPNTVRHTCTVITTNGREIPLQIFTVFDATSVHIATVEFGL